MARIVHFGLTAAAAFILATCGGNVLANNANAGGTPEKNASAFYSLASYGFADRLENPNPSPALKNRGRGTLRITKSPVHPSPLNAHANSNRAKAST
jgi:hypothetical protein